MPEKPKKPKKPRKPSNLTARYRILILLTYQKLENSTSAIARQIGLSPSQVGRDLEYLREDGFVEVKDNLLFLTQKGREEPLISSFRGIRLIGKLCILISIISWVLDVILYSFSILGANFIAYMQMIELICIIFIMGAVLFFYPGLLLEAAKRKRSNDQPS